MQEITIVCEDCAGMLAEIAETLGAAGVNIETLDAESVGNSAVFVLTVDKYDEALRALANTRFTAISEDAIVARLDDNPGELGRVLSRFKEAKINIRSLRIIRRDAGKSIVAIATRRTEEAKRLLGDLLISPSEEE